MGPVLVFAFILLFAAIVLYALSRKDEVKADLQLPFVTLSFEAKDHEDGPTKK